MPKILAIRDIIMTLMHRNHRQSTSMRYSDNTSMTTHRYQGICFGGQFNSFLKGLFFWWSPISLVKFFWFFGSAIPTSNSNHRPPPKVAELCGCNEFIIMKSLDVWRCHRNFMVELSTQIPAFFKIPGGCHRNCVFYCF